MHSSVKQTIESIVRETETALATELRVMEATLSREQNASELASLPKPATVALTLFGPSSLASRVTWRQRRPTGASRTEAHRQGIPSHYAEARAGVPRASALTGGCRRTSSHRPAGLGCLGVSRDGRAPWQRVRNPPLAHPCIRSGRRQLRKRTLPRTDAQYPWFLSNTAGAVCLGGFFLSAAAIVVSLTTYLLLPLHLAMAAIWRIRSALACLRTRSG
jgi:hypothetical protein